MEKLLVQAYERFGDNLCSAGAISQIRDAEIIVCTSREFDCALLNMPNVKEIVYMDNRSAHTFARENHYKIIDTTLSTVPIQVNQLDARVPMHLKRNGYDYIKNGPAFFPTKEELDWAEEFAGRFNDKPLLGVESHFSSEQSYMNKVHNDKIVNKYHEDYHILWLCNGNYPSSKEKIVDMGEFNRRQISTLMPKLSLLISSFSGFYWASRCFKSKPKAYLLVQDRYIDWTKCEDVEYIREHKFDQWASKPND